MNICSGGPWPQSNCIGNGINVEEHLLHGAFCPEWAAESDVCGWLNVICMAVEGCSYDEQLYAQHGDDREMGLIIAKPSVISQKHTKARAASRPPPKTAKLVTMHRSRRPAALSSSMAAFSAARLQAAPTLKADTRLLTQTLAQLACIM